jgi:hypothetical protein
LTFLTTDFGSALTLVGFFACFTAFGVGFIEGVGEFDVVGVVRVVTSGVFEGSGVTEWVRVATEEGS